MEVVHVISCTDPACPWSWGAEPAVRRLEEEFAGTVRMTYVMAGLAREFGRPADVAAAALDAAAASGMPVDPRGWLGAQPPRSSHPACLAVLAAAEQGLAAPALRRLREGFMVERRRLDTVDALAEALRDLPGLDSARLRVDLASSATLERLGADLERVRALRGHDRPGGQLPLVAVEGAGTLEGRAVTPDALAGLVRSAGARPSPARPGVLDALARRGRLALPEVAEACGLARPRAAAELWALAADLRVRADRVLAGELWSLADASS